VYQGRKWGPLLASAKQLALTALCALSFGSLLFAGQANDDWQARVRDLVQKKNLTAALHVADARLAAAPQDLEARGWRARLLAWSGRWNDAESEYRTVLESAPNDVDILVGLSYVLAWEKRYNEAIVLLKRAEEIDPKNPEVDVALGRALRGTGQRRLALQNALLLDPQDEDAKSGLDSLRAAPHFTLSGGLDVDTFNYTSSAYAVTNTLTDQINSKWLASVSAVGQSRFGSDAGTFLSSLGYRFTAHDSLTIGGGFANAQPVVPQSQAFFEYGHGFTVAEQGPLRAVETSYRQQWYWYHGARILTLTPQFQLDLPREWYWSFQLTEARSTFQNLAPGWEPSGLTRLGFPLYRTLRGNVFWAVGTEDFTLVDQIGSFAARTYGGGLSYWWKERFQLSGYVAVQDRSQGRSQTSYGAAYALRF
jgi:tetratricopeptide (TPR) repeat protein